MREDCIIAAIQKHLNLKTLAEFWTSPEAKALLEEPTPRILSQARKYASMTQTRESPIQRKESLIVDQGEAFRKIQRAKEKKQRRKRDRAKRRGMSAAPTKEPAAPGTVLEIRRAGVDRDDET